MTTGKLAELDKAWDEVHSALTAMFERPLPIEKIGWDLHRALVILAPYRLVNQKKDK